MPTPAEDWWHANAFPEQHSSDQSERCPIPHNATQPHIPGHCPRPGYLGIATNNTRFVPIPRSMAQDYSRTGDRGGWLPSTCLRFLIRQKNIHMDGTALLRNANRRPNCAEPEKEACKPLSWVSHSTDWGLLLMCSFWLTQTYQVFVEIRPLKCRIV